jgi:integrase
MSLNEHGIIFKRSEDGDGIFLVNVMVDGHRIHRVIGRESDGTTRTQAEEFIAKARDDAKKDRLSLPKGRKIALGFKEAAEKYLARSSQEGGKNLAGKKKGLNMHLIPFFGDTPLKKVHSFDVERYKKARKEEGAANGTVNRELATLSHLFNKAIEWGWLDNRPATIRRFKEEGGRITYLTVDQIKRLIDKSKEDQNPQIYPFIVIGLETSMRKMEILSIRREHVDLEKRVIFIPKAKAGAREQPIPSSLVKFLEGYLNALPSDETWLFPSPTSKEGHTVEVRKAFRRVVEAAGMNPDEVLRHTLRHTAITHLVQAGVDLPTVKRISGHKTLIMVERYAHQNGEHIKSAMDRLEERYKGVLGS